MRPYHGLPITPEVAAVEAVSGGAAFVSHRYPDQLRIAIECTQSFALDNGAFSAWTNGTPVQDWGPFYEWAAGCKRLPMCDFAVIPDVIKGSEADNDALIHEWPLGKFFGAPVWHMHESLERLESMVSEWPRVCIGSSGEYKTPGSALWWGRMADAMGVACDKDGFPKTKLHGLRMLNPKITTRLPLSSADSTNIGQNIGIDKAWKGPYPPAGKAARARVMRQRIESHQSPPAWDFSVEPLNGDQLW